MSVSCAWVRPNNSFFSNFSRISIFNWYSLISSMRFFERNCSMFYLVMLWSSSFRLEELTDRTVTLIYFRCSSMLYIVWIACMFDQFKILDSSLISFVGTDDYTGKYSLLVFNSSDKCLKGMFGRFILGMKYSSLNGCLLVICRISLGRGYRVRI